MIPLGFFPVLIIPVNLILIQLRTGESLAIPPVSEPRQIHGGLAEKQTLVHSSGRERREIQCQVGHYRHPNGTHCCIKCPKGNYLSEHCSGPGKAPKCSECREGEYMDTENFSTKCFACQLCRTGPGFQQITKSNCTKREKTVCGCHSHQYKTTSKAEFLCKNCSDCQNGKTRQGCTPDRDAICECHRGFFLQEDQNKCLPCSSCDQEDCKDRCEMERVVTTPSNSKELISVLIFLTVIFAVGFGALTFKVVKKYLPERQFFPSCTSAQASKKQLTSETADKTKNSLLDIKEEATTLGTVPVQTLTLSQAQEQELPDCVKSARASQISDNAIVLYTVVDAVPVKRWKQFVRYLGLSDNTIDRIFDDHRDGREARYETLKEWSQANKDATLEHILECLRTMNLNNSVEEIQAVLAVRERHGSIFAPLPKRTH